MLGKHAFVPKISPKKTWEGVSGGIFLRYHHSVNLSVFTALILSQLNVLSMVHLDPVHTKHFLIISLIVSVVSIFGDFVESFLKRVADVKDSGTFFPGHGGVLDRVHHLITTLDGLFMLQCTVRVPLPKANIA
jgi:phosphatidate cytidylyltransferase